MHQTRDFFELPMDSFFLNISFARQIEMAYVNTVLYALFIFLRNTSTVGPQRQVLSNFLSDRSRGGSLTVQIWFPTRQYSVEAETFEFSLQHGNFARAF